MSKENEDIKKMPPLTKQLRTSPLTITIIVR